MRPRSAQHGRSSRARRCLIAAAVASVAVVILAACGSGGTSATSSRAVLTIAGDDGGPFPASENPYGATNGLGQLTPFVYEPLFQFNWLKPTQVTPWLATGYAWSNGGRTLSLTIRSGVKWSDNQPFTAADVAFTYNLVKNNPAINTNGLQISTVSQNENTVDLTFAQPAYSQFYYIASTYIVPQHIWKNYQDPATAQNANPVGTGPYLVSTYSPQSIILKANPRYWQGAPKVQEIVEPDILSNNTCDSELYTGQAQWGGCYLADFSKFKASPNNVFSSSPEQLQGLIPNLTQFPMSSLAFRQAVSLTLNRQAVAVAGDQGEEPAITSPTGLVLPAEQVFMDPAYATLHYQQNIPQAKAILTKAGFKWSPSGVLEGPSGSPINVSILVVAAYSDNVAAAETILQEFKAIGLQGSLKLEAAPAVTADEEKGNFQFAEGSSAAGVSPYVVYNSLLNSALSAPVGGTATGDFERYKSAAADTYLSQLAGANSLAAQKQAAYGLEGVMIRDLPIIPFMYTVAWGEYNTANFTGWPTSTAPYALGTTYYTPEDELVVLNLRPKS